MSSSKSVQSNKFTPVKNLSRPRVGVIYSPTSKDPNERLFAKMFSDQGSKERYGKTLGELLGCDFVHIDFHEILEGIKNPDSPEGQTDLKEKLKAELKKNGISGVISPGNDYNVIAPNQNKNHNRTYVERAVWDISNLLGIPLMGICGGEQRWAFEAIIKGLGQLSSEEKSQEQKAIADSMKSGVVMTNNTKELTKLDHCPKDGPSNIVHPLILMSGPSILMGCYQQATKQKDQKWDTTHKKPKVFYVNSAHNQSILNTELNKKALNKMGLRVVAINDTGEIVEAIDNEHGAPKILVQYHPEYFAEGRKHSKEEKEPDTDHLIGMDIMQNLMYSFVGSCRTYHNKQQVKATAPLASIKEEKCLENKVMQSRPQDIQQKTQEQPVTTILSVPNIPPIKTTKKAPEKAPEKTSWEKLLDSFKDKKTLENSVKQMPHYMKTTKCYRQHVRAAENERSTSYTRT